MALVVVVSRNPGLALAFSPRHHAVAISPDDIPTAPLQDADALVVDLGDPAASLVTATAARTQRPELSVVLVTNGNPEWARIPFERMERTFVVPQPAGRDALCAAVDSATERGSPTYDEGDPPVAAPPPDSVSRGRVLIGPGTDEAVPSRPRPPESTTSKPPVRKPAMKRPSRHKGNKQSQAIRHAAPKKRPSAGEPPGLAPRLGAVSTPAVPSAEPSPDDRLRTDVNALVAALVARAADLYSVPEIAAVLVAELVERVDAKACAVLVPDGPRWRVSGDVGLRVLERRLELGFDHWLVKEVVGSQHGLVVEDSDITRGVLAGAPMASYQNLMAVPVPAARGIVIVGRGVSRPFTEKELAVVAGVAAEADPLLGSAMAGRALARELAALTDLETPRTRRSHSV